MRWKVWSWAACAILGAMGGGALGALNGLLIAGVSWLWGRWPGRFGADRYRPTVSAISLLTPLGMAALFLLVLAIEDGASGFRDLEGLMMFVGAPAVIAAPCCWWVGHKVAAWAEQRMAR